METEGEKDRLVGVGRLRADYGTDEINQQTGAQRLKDEDRHHEGHPKGHRDPIPMSVLLTPSENATRWRSIRLMYLIMFLGFMAFSICLMSMWPFLTILDSSSTADFFGYVVAAYSVGQFISSPILGGWTVYLKRAREPLLLSTLILIGANLLYAFLEDTRPVASYIMLLARFFTGLGAGSVAVCRACVADMTDEAERPAAFTNLVIGQAVGFAMGPGIQAAFVPLGYPGPVVNSMFHVNMYTAPALLSAFISILTLPLIMWKFKEFNIIQLRKERGGQSPLGNGSLGINGSVQERDDDEEESTSCSSFFVERSWMGSGGSVRPSWIGAGVAMFAFFSTQIMISIMDTMPTPLLMDLMGWSRADSTFYTGVVFAGCLVIVILSMVGGRFLASRFDERKILITVFFLGILAFGVIFPFSSEPIEKIAEIGLSHLNGSAIPGNGSDTLEVGCHYDWCSTASRIYPSQLFVQTMILSFTCPTICVMIVFILSKILGDVPQGLVMGVCSAAGSLGRLVGPLVGTWIYARKGLLDMMIVFLVFFAATNLLLIAFYKTMKVKNDTRSKE